MPYQVYHITRIMKTLFLILLQDLSEKFGLSILFKGVLEKKQSM